MTESILERRRIEAEFAKGIHETLVAELGEQRAGTILTKAIVGLAEKAGAAFAAEIGREPNLEDLADILRFWTMNDALVLDVKERTPRKLDFDVRRCRYAEMYAELGVAELGAILSCNRDGAFCTGFNPNIKLTRSQTIMEGASHCDFRYVLTEDEAAR